LADFGSRQNASILRTVPTCHPEPAKRGEGPRAERLGQGHFESCQGVTPRVSRKSANACEVPCRPSAVRDDTREGPSGHPTSARWISP
jgi:hypothetical protein